MRRTRTPSPPPRGTTLVELMVTLVLLGLLASVAALAARVHGLPPSHDPFVVLADSAHVAAAQSRAIVLRLVAHETTAVALVEPDGSVIADSILHVDRLTGTPSNAR